MPVTLRGVKQAVLSAVTVLTLIVLVLAAALLGRDHTFALDRASERVSRVAGSSETEVNRNFVSVDLMLAELATWTAEEYSSATAIANMPNLKETDQNLHRLARSALNQNLMLRDIAVLASNGKVLVGAMRSTVRLGMPLPPGFLASVVEQSFPGLMVSAPALNPLNSEQVLYLARSQRLSDGSRIVAIAELQLSLLADLLKPEDDSQRLTVTLEKETGQLLASFPAMDVLIGQTLQPALTASAVNALLRDQAGRLQPDPSIMAVRPTLYAGIVLSVGMPRAAALADWTSERTIVLSGALALLALVWAGGLATWRSFQQMANARAEVAKANTQLHSSNQLLAGSLSLVKATLESTGDAVLVVGNDGRIQHFNALFSIAMKVPKEVLATGELSPVRQLILAQLINPDDFLEGNARAYGSPTAELHDQLLFKDGRFFQRHTLPQLLDGQVMGRVWRFQDVTAFKQAEQKLQLAASVFSHAHEGISITDANGTIIDVNDTFSRITGYHRDEVIGQNPRILQSGRQSSEYYAAMWHELLEHGRWVGEVWNRRKNGDIYAEMLSISAVRDAGGKTQHYVALFTDITSLKQHAQQLEHIAHFDALTNLPNRVLMADRLNQAMAQTQRRGQSLAVVYLDLDGFKAVNDLHGHDVGDQLLVALSSGMNPDFPLARSRRVICGEFDRQVELLGLIP